jgi:hypothetical protein
MKIRAAILFVAMVACGGGDKDGGGKEGGSGAALTLPKVYPPVRAATPSALIADPTYAQALTAFALTDPGDTMPGSNRDGGTPDMMNPGDTMPGSMNPDGGMPGDISLGLAVQQRFYSPGPTSLLRIVKELDDRVAGLDPRPAKHPCLTATPIATTYALPGGQSFAVKLQCLDSRGSDWVAFGFGTALAAPDAGAPDKDAGAFEDDAGPPDGGALGAEGGGDDFFLIQGQSTGNGGAYHVKRSTGEVEGWIAVADRVATGNSQVVMHMLTSTTPRTLELTLGGSAVGFCSAHLKTGADLVYVQGKTNAPPPAGTPAGAQACAPVRSGCFAANALNLDLGATSPACASLAAGSFHIATDLDASPGAGANVTPASIYTLFSQPPTGIAAF